MHAYSAPGKALLAGGYLVIDPLYPAYVTALSLCMHSVAEVVPSDETIVEVDSPQFAEGHWKYRVIYDSASDQWSAEGLEGGSNPFLAAAVATVWNYTHSPGGHHKVTIYLDPGFHAPSDSQRTSVTGTKQFHWHPTRIDLVPKTGLGSSAGLVVVVCAALLGPDHAKNLDLIHNLAQIAHCRAQQKIGLGFDIAAAVYGLIKFQRFDPKLVDGAINHPETIRDVAGKKWDFGHDLISLPPKLRLLMGDIAGGSNTPKLVAQVHQWKRELPQEALRVYTELNAANIEFMKQLEDLDHLAAADPARYEQAVAATSTPELQNLHNAIEGIRKSIREMTKLSGATIEPPQQSELLNACNSLPGCIGGMVPGAGGYDAICILVVASQLDKLVAACELDSRFANVNWLDLEERSSGLVEEEVDGYQFE